MPNRVPSLRRHKPSKQGVVTLNGHDHYLGSWPEGCREPPEHVRAEYDRLLARWIAGGRQLVQARAHDDAGPSVNEVLVGYLRHAEGYYRHPDGRPTTEASGIKPALRRLKEMFGHRPAATVDSLDLQALRDRMVNDGLSRPHVNKDLGRAKRVFKWAAQQKLIPAATFQDLALAPGLRFGRSDAPENEPVKPVPVAFVEAVLPYAGQQVAAMVQLQELTGMRPGEVCIMRTIDIDTTGEVWLYRPAHHKLAYRNKSRVVAIGPRAQAVLKPWLRLNLHEYLFQPAEAEAARQAERRQRRKTRVQPSQAGRKRKAKPKRAPRERYTTDTYGHAILYAINQANKARLCDRCKLAQVKAACPECKAKFIPRWAPNQLRHTYATEVRRKFGLEAAQVTLGHSKADVTQVYAERDLELASKVAAAMG